MTTEQKNSASNFATAMREVFGMGERQEAVSAKVLFAMIEMDATFDLVWLEAFVKAENRAKTKMIETALADLSPDYNELVILADTKVTDIRKETNAAKKERMQQDKAAAQAKVKAAQNMIRSVAMALLYFRSVDLDKITLTDRKRIRWSIKEQGWFNMVGVTFKECVEMGKAVAAERDWIVIKVSQGPSKVGSHGPANEGESLIEKAKSSNFLTLVKTMANLFKTIDLENLSESEQDAVRDLEETLIRRTYADEKGKIDVKMLIDYYKEETKKEDQKKTAA